MHVKDSAFVLRLPGPRSVCLLLLLPLLAAGGLCLFYLAHSYSYLIRWYLGLHTPIIHQAEWTILFFNPVTRREGIVIAWGSLVLCAVLLAVFLRWFIRTKPAPVYMAFSRKDAAWAGLVALLSGAACAWAWGQLPLCIDELFSTVHCSSLHPFQTLSYYMDPNNHLLFNLTNNLLFAPFGGDLAMSGRLISCASFVLLSVVLFFWLKQLLKSGLIALLFLATLALQLQVLGFAVTGRGYALCLLCQWGAFISLYSYMLAGRRRYLGLFAVANVLGLFTVLTYAYFLVALLLAAGISQALSRRVDGRFWVYQLVAGFYAALLYLPVLLFSGRRSFRANTHTRPEPDFQLFDGPRLKHFVTECFWDNTPSRLPFYLALIALPVAVLMLGRLNGRRLILTMYLCLWPGYWLVTLVLRHHGFTRSLVGQESFMIFGVLLAFFAAGQWAAGKMKKRKRMAGYAAPALITALLFWHFARVFPTHISRELYHLDWHHHEADVRACLSKMPADAVIASPGFSAAFYYYGRNNHPHLHTWMDGNEDFIILNRFDSYAVPPGYVYFDDPFNYFVYKREAPQAARAY